MTWQAISGRPRPKRSSSSSHLNTPMLSTVLTSSPFAASFAYNQGQTPHSMEI